MKAYFNQHQLLNFDLVFDKETEFVLDKNIYNNKFLNDLCKKINEEFSFDGDDEFNVGTITRGELGKNFFEFGEICLFSNKDSSFSIILKQNKTKFDDGEYFIECDLLIEEFDSFDYITKKLNKVLGEVNE